MLQCLLKQKNAKKLYRTKNHCVPVQLGASLTAQWVKNPPAMQETEKMQVQFLGREDPLEEGMATHSRILAWRIPWTEEPGGLQPKGSQRVGHDWVSKHPWTHACAVGANSGQKIQRDQKPNCHFWEAWSKNRVWEVKTAYLGMPTAHHTTKGVGKSPKPL